MIMILLEVHHFVCLHHDVVGTVDVVVVVGHGEGWTAHCTHGAVEEASACCKKNTLISHYNCS